MRHSQYIAACTCIRCQGMRMHRVRLPRISPDPAPSRSSSPSRDLEAWASISAPGCPASWHSSYMYSYTARGSADEDPCAEQTRRHTVSTTRRRPARMPTDTKPEAGHLDHDRHTRCRMLSNTRVRICRDVSAQEREGGRQTEEQGWGGNAREQARRKGSCEAHEGTCTH